MIPVALADEPKSFDAHVRKRGAVAIQRLLRQCVAQRGDFITRYRAGQIDLRNVELYAPFIASELRRQGQLVRGDA